CPRRFSFTPRICLHADFLDGLTTVAVVALTQTHSKPPYHSGRMAAQCRTGNRRCCTVPATEPNRAAVEIALPYMCGAEIRAAGEVPSTRGAQAGRPEGSRAGGGDRCAACAALQSLLSLLATASSARRPLGRCPMATDASPGGKCRQNEDSRQHTPSGRARPAPSTSGETC